MPVTILNSEYENRFRPQDNNISWPLGNIGTWQRLILDIQVEARIGFDSTNNLFMEQPNVFTLANGKNWREFGFEVGKQFLIKWTTTDVGTGSAFTSQVTGTILSIDGSTFVSSNITLGTGALASNIYPYQGAEEKIHSVFIATDQEPEQIELVFGHIVNQNIDSGNFASFIDGTESRFKLDNVDNMSVNQTLNFLPLAFRSGTSIDNVSLTFEGQQNDTIYQGKYFYTLIIDFMYSAFFEDINTLEDNEPPPQMFDKDCLTDLFNIKAFPISNNPNLFIENDLSATKQLGNTGWFDENYNGLPDDFIVSSIEFFDINGQLVDNLDYSSTTKVVAIIDGVANASGQNRCSLGFQWIPTEEVYYKNLTTPYHENTKICTAGINTSAFSASNAIDTNTYLGFSNDGAQMDVKNIRFQPTGATQITFECEFVPNLAFTAFMDNIDETERNYWIWVSLADATLETKDSNRVSKKLASGTLEKFVPPLGEWEGMTIEFLNHTQDETDSENPAGNDIKIEDDLLAKVLFTVDTAISDEIPIPQSISYGFLLQRTSDEFRGELETYSIDLTQFPSPEQYNFKASRGFKLGTNNNKNFVWAIHEPTLDNGTEKGVLGLYGFKVRWEDWLAKLNLPQEVISAFYDNQLPNNGVSNDWYRYLQDSGWTLNFYVYIDAVLGGVLGRYTNLKELTFNDYDQNSNITTEITYFRESDNTILSGGIDPISGLPLGVILDNELVRLRIEYTNLLGNFPPLNQLYGLNTIEVRDGAGQFEYRQLSSIWNSENDNPLLAIAPDTLLTLSLPFPNILRAECLIDPSKLIDSNRYKITGREGCI